MRNTPAAACALLGRQADSTTYIKGDECLDALKDLQQFLHRDDPVGEIDQVRARTAPAPPARRAALGQHFCNPDPLHAAVPTLLGCCLCGRLRAAGAGGRKGTRDQEKATVGVAPSAGGMEHSDVPHLSPAYLPRAR